MGSNIWVIQGCETMTPKASLCTPFSAGWDCQKGLSTGYLLWDGKDERADSGEEKKKSERFRECKDKRRKDWEFDRVAKKLVRSSK